MKTKFLYFAAIFFIIVFISNGSLLFVNLRNSKVHKMQQATLSAIVTTNNAHSPPTQIQHSRQTTQISDVQTSTAAPVEAFQDERLENYQRLNEMNPDTVGWISIKDTSLDYPVMQTKKTPNFYLTHDFEKKKNLYGVPYVDENCELFDSPSSNIIIYGHNMRDGDVFGVLENYEKKDFYEKHKTLNFDTLIQENMYEIIAFFKTTNDENGFHYSDFINLDAKSHAEFIKEIKSLSLYDIAIDSEYGRQLVTLSTCSSYNNNERVVLVAQKTDKTNYDSNQN